MKAAMRSEFDVVTFPEWQVAEISSFKEPPLVQFNPRLKRRDVARWQFLLFGAICSCFTAIAIKLLQL